MRLSIGEFIVILFIIFLLFGNFEKIKIFLKKIYKSMNEDKRD